MTYHELKAEAERQGYDLVSNKPFKEPARCRECGRYPELWTMGRFYKRQCSYCKTMTDWYDSPGKAKQVWNLMQGVIDT